jgi:hypothetical protein
MFAGAIISVVQYLEPLRYEQAPAVHEQIRSRSRRAHQLEKEREQTLTANTHNKQYAS